MSNQYSGPVVQSAVSQSLFDSAIAGSFLNSQVVGPPSGDHDGLGHSYGCLLPAELDMWAQSNIGSVPVDESKEPHLRVLRERLKKVQLGRQYLQYELQSQMANPMADGHFMGEARPQCHLQCHRNN